LPSGVRPEQVCDIDGMRQRHYVDAQSFLFRAGEACGRVYMLRYGLVKLTKSLPDGREQIIGLRRAGHVVGFEGVDDEVYRHSAQAMTSAVACSVAYKDMTHILSLNPAASLHTIRMLTRELEKAQTMIGDLGMKNANERIATLIVSFVPDDSAPPDRLSIPLLRREIAELLGLSLETVSRVIAEYVRSGLVKAPRGSHEWVILDFPRLRQMAGDGVE
jgi:CRP/FNR family transcriptional regulator